MLQFKILFFDDVELILLWLIFEAWYFAGHQTFAYEIRQLKYIFNKFFFLA